MQRQHYTTERKMQILARYASSDEQLKDILADEGIPKSTFTQWLREYDKYAANGELAFTPKNVRHLIRENHHLKDVINDLHASCCRGTFYNHINRNKRDNAWFFVRREKLKPVIERIFDESNQTYGYRKVTTILRS